MKRLEQRVLLLRSLKTSIFFCILILANSFKSEFFHGIWIFSAAALTMTITYFSYNQRKIKYFTASHLLIGSLTIPILTVLFLTGGFKSYAIPFAVIIPMVCQLFLGNNKHSFFWLTIFISVIAVIATLQLFFVEIPDLYNHDYYLNNLMVSFIVAAMVLFIFTSIFESQRVKAQIKVEETQNELKLKTKIEAQNKELTLAYNDLKNTQSLMVHSEKMIALGTMVSGVTHEINTPLAVIQGGIGNLEAAHQEYAIYSKCRERFSESDKKVMDHLSSLVENSKNIELTSREERAARKTIQNVLSENGFQNRFDLSDQLVKLKFHIYVDQVTPYIQEQNFELFIKILANELLIKNNFKNMTRSSDKIRNIIRAMKNYSHYGRDEDPKEVNIIEGIETILVLYYNELKHSINVIKDFSRDEFLVMGRADQLDQVWTNLINNAIHAMEGEGELEIKVFEEGKNVVVQIRDTGTGVHKDIQTKIFETFYTTKAKGVGTGLGLSISQEILKKHDGAISFRSQPGKTIFTVKIPLNKQEGSEMFFSESPLVA